MSKSKRVIAINSREHRIYEAEVSDLSDLQKLVGGYIERGHILENGDEVYVNEEGLFEEDPPLFYIEGAHQPFAGNGYIIGSVTPSGDNRAAKSTLEEIRLNTRFLTAKEES